MYFLVDPSSTSAANLGGFKMLSRWLVNNHTDVPILDSHTVAEGSFDEQPDNEASGTPKEDEGQLEHSFKNKCHQTACVAVQQSHLCSGVWAMKWTTVCLLTMMPRAMCAKRSRAVRATPAQGIGY